MVTLLDWAYRLFPSRHDISVLTAQPSEHRGGVASGGSATNGASPSSILEIQSW